MERNGSVLPKNPISLPPKSEIRIIFNEGQKANFKVVKGIAEVFGSEIVFRKDYDISYIKNFPIFTWQGCDIIINGGYDFYYVSYETLANRIFDIESQIFEREKCQKIPKMLLAGKRNSGQKSTCKTMINYAIRQEYSTFLVDFDLNSNLLTVPGAVAVSLIDRIIDRDSDLSTADSLVCFFGQKSIKKLNFDNYKKCVDYISEALEKRLEFINKDQKNNIFVVVRANSPTSDLELQAIEYIIQKFSITDFTTLGLETLSQKMRIKQKSLIQLHSLPISGGILPVTDSSKITKTASLFQRYFYGSFQDLFPSTKSFRLGSFVIYQSNENFVPISALPKGENSVTSTSKVKKKAVTKDLENSILGVLKLKKDDGGFSLVVAGFVCVVGVSEEKQKMTIICPNGENLTPRRFLYSEFKWIDKN